MSVLNDELVRSDSFMKSDKIHHQREIAWNDLETNYVIRNVPSIYLDENDYYYTAEVSSKLMVLKELMEEKSIPNDIDFNDVSDVQV